MKIKMENQKFIPWFIGFMDAEGGFLCHLVPRINRKNIATSYKILRAIHLGLNLKDLSLIEFINQKLGNIGNIYQYPIKQECKLAISSNENIVKFIQTVFSETENTLLTIHQATRYEQLRKVVIEKIISVKTTEQFEDIQVKQIIPSFEACSSFYLDYWLSGFLNGEVSFTTFKGKSGNLKPQVFLEHTDERAVNFFRNYLNLNPKVHSRQRDNRKLTYSIKITSVKDLNSIIQFLDRTEGLLGNKLFQYNEWKDRFFSK
uniref:Putative LAGLIDADG homing endonuclease n=1 Tax=Grifola frondosa TaxID=5627 RepID=H1ZWQ6_GRIFR|nr:putative LAGLIDADG homing endonuclease [Grifola frondosa]